MNTDIKVTIITVCLNSEKTIKKSIESILHQTYDNIEYLIIDGKSTDKTLDIIKEYEPEFHGKMRWISEKDDGLYYAMNKGIEMATGDLIGILNSDDTYELDAVENMVKAYEPGTYQILYGLVRFFDGEEMSSVSLTSHKGLPDHMINHPGCFVSTNVYRKYGMFDTQYVSAADYDFMIRMCEQSEIKFVPVYSLISNFYRGGISQSHVAYLDYLKLQMNYNKIPKRKYYFQLFLYKLICIKHRVIGK